MMGKHIVFIGDERTQYTLRHMPRIFERNGWTVQACQSIEEAKQQKQIDAMVVYANRNDHVEDFNKWEKHPPTIWFFFSYDDTIPPDINVMGPVALPTDLYHAVMKIAVE